MESSGLTSLPSAATTESSGGGHDNNNDSNISTQFNPVTSCYSNSAPRKPSSPKKNGGQEERKLSRKTSLKLFQKANALQNRPYIWCYRPFSQKKEEAAENQSSPDVQQAPASSWTAFDVKNQTKLDNQYAFILAKASSQQQQQAGPEENLTPQSQQQQQESKALKITDDPSFIITLDKQSNLFSPVMVSIKDGLAWYHKSNAQSNNNELAYELLEITYLPTHYNRLVVSNDLLEKQESSLQQRSLRRAKSMDGFTSRVLNTVLSW